MLPVFETSERKNIINKYKHDLDKHLNSTPPLTIEHANLTKAKQTLTTEENVYLDLKCCKLLDPDNYMNYFPKEPPTLDEFLFPRKTISKARSKTKTKHYNN